ncbi:MAG: hypothetical protein L6R35_004146, partial [Caloplaca aegaea]
VRDAADEPEVLIHGRWIQARVRVLWAQLVELVGEAGGVAGGGDGVFGVENVFGDPGGETAFEAAIADGVVGGTGGLTGWGWRGRRVAVPQAEDARVGKPVVCVFTVVVRNADKTWQKPNPQVFTAEIGSPGAELDFWSSKGLLTCDGK